MTRDALPPIVSALVGAYRRMLEERFGARLLDVRLFGSYARGDAGEDSDADVAVIIDDLTESERTLAIDLALEAWRLDTSAPLLSPLVWTSAQLEDRRRAERRIARDIFTEGFSV